MVLVIPAFVAAIVALFAVLLAIAADLLIRAIGKALGSFNIGLGISIPIGKWFEDAADNVVTWAVNLGKSAWIDLAHWFGSAETALRVLFYSVIQAVTHLGDQIAHIVTSIIPDAVREAETYGDKALSSAVATIEGLARHAVNVADEALSDASRAATRAEAAVLADVDKAILQTVASGVDVAEGFAAREVSALKSYAERIVSEARAAAVAEVAELKRTLGQQLSTLTDTVQRDFSAAEDYAKVQATRALSTAEQFATKTAAEAERAAENVAQSAALSAEKTAEGFAQTAVGALSSTLTPEIEAAQNAASAAGAAAAAAGTAAAAAASTGSSALAAAGADAAAAAAGAATGLADALGGVYTDLTGQAVAANGDLSSIEGLLSGAILGVVGAVAARVSKLEECSVGVCDDSPNNFGNLLNDALDVIGIASIAPFLVAAIQQPAQGEQVYADTVNTLFSDGEQLLNTLLGAALTL